MSKAQTVSHAHELHQKYFGRVDEVLVEIVPYHYTGEYMRTIMIDLKDLQGKKYQNSFKVTLPIGNPNDYKHALAYINLRLEGDLKDIRVMELEYARNTRIDRVHPKQMRRRSSFLLDEH